MGKGTAGVLWEKTQLECCGQRHSQSAVGKGTAGVLWVKAQLECWEQWHSWIAVDNDIASVVDNGTALWMLAWPVYHMGIQLKCFKLLSAEMYLTKRWWGNIAYFSYITLYSVSFFPTTDVFKQGVWSTLED